MSDNKKYKLCIRCKEEIGVNESTCFYCGLVQTGFFNVKCKIVISIVGVLILLTLIVFIINDLG